MTRYANGLPPGYDRLCADLSDGESKDRAHRGESHIIRFKEPDQYPEFLDLVYGRTGQGSKSGRKLHLSGDVYNDPVLIKSDGHPTYHFANVIDDHLMKITHVIRGSEWMSSTPLHMAIYNAYNWKPPSFAHVPLLVDEQNQKLSKRNFDSDMSAFQDRGIFPDALANFAALLGWSHQGSSDVMNLKQLEMVFDSKFTKGSTIVSLDKLYFLQKQHALRYIDMEGEQFNTMVQEILEVLEQNYNAQVIQALAGGREPKKLVALMLRAQKDSYISPKSFANKCSIFFAPLPSMSELKKPAKFSLQSLSTAAMALCFVPAQDWTAVTHRRSLAELQMQFSLGGNSSKDQRKAWSKDLYPFLREVLLGSGSGPSIPDTMEILGKDICTERIQSAALRIRSQKALETEPDIDLTTTAV